METDPNTAEHHILLHPVNPVYNTEYFTSSDKAWARRFRHIRNITIHTVVDNEQRTQANFDDAFFPLDADDTLRMSEPAVPPNTRQWRFEMEADCENWFHTEVSNVVLAAFTRYPYVLQSSHIKPFEEEAAENVDVTYSVKLGDRRFPLAIGEIKRNLIRPGVWQRGGPLTGSQKTLSQELRGYARKYHCPQVFCFDGETLLLLQFRARELQKLEDEDCPVDCWVLPRQTSYFTLRYALYRLLVQGWRRCQVDMNVPAVVGGMTSHFREFFNGRPIWRGEGGLVINHPLGYVRTVEAATGALKWTHEEDPGGVYESVLFWE